MNIWHNVILAIVQGFTEFLPISSSAHLILIPKLLNWPDQGLDFDITVHLGTLCAVLLYFKKDLIKLSDPFYHLTQKLILATIPVCMIGFLLKPYITLYLRSPIIIAIATIVFGLLLGYSQTREKHFMNNLEQITIKQALVIGLFQCLALIPGTSRAGITITAALLVGLPRKVAAEFSFLLSIPVILLSSGILTMDIINNYNLITLDLYSYIIGFTLSALVAISSMHFFIKLLDRIGMLPFVIYRIILGCFLLFVFL